jgi:thioredoxin-related protein
VIKKVEVLANIAVIITSVFLCTVLAKKYFFSGSAKQPVAAAATTSQIANTKRTIQPGTKISLPGIDWSKSDRTLLLALSTGCHFCSESAPFYQNLEQQKLNDVRLLALFPQPVEDGRIYLNKLGVSVSEIVQSPLASVGVSGTPTLLLIDKQGTVINSWIGKLPDDEQEKVIAQIRE